MVYHVLSSVIIVKYRLMFIEGVLLPGIVLDASF